MCSAATIAVTLHKPGKGQIIRYDGDGLIITPTYVLLLARWTRPPLDLGYVVFETGDSFYEHFYADRWYNIFDIRSAAGMRKGWYCNITRPAQLSATTVVSEDLELDLFVSADRQTLLRLDEDEFAARGFADTEPATYHAAFAALEELEHMARTGSEPFGEG